jgi:FkbM family methyltransferase
VATTIVSVARRALGDGLLYPFARRVFGSVALQRRIRSCYRHFVKPGDLVFDIGANLGSRTEALVRLGASVVAVEPQPLLAERLRRRFASHPRVTIVEQAIDSTEREAAMYVCSLHLLTTLSRQRMESARRRPEFAHATWRETRTRTITFDALIRDHGRPAFAKIDVESYELEVLRGLSTPVRALSFEVTPRHPQEALACLGEIGRLGRPEFNLARGETMRLVFAPWLTPEAMERYCRDDLPRESAYADVYVRLT